MTTATKIEHTTTKTAGLIEDAGDSVKRFGQWIFNGLVAIGELSANARSAREFAYLNQLSDDELAARKLKRADLPAHCFGPKIYL